jgi:hypothetical protein
MVSVKSYTSDNKNRLSDIQNAFIVGKSGSVEQLDKDEVLSTGK